MVAGPSRLLGVVPQPGPLDRPAVEGQDRRVAVPDGTGTSPRVIPEPGPQQIVDLHEASEFFRAEFPQEIPQGRVGGEARQPQQALEGAIVRQDPGIRDSLQARDHAVKQAQDQFRRMVGTVPPLPGDVGLEQSLQAQLSTKLLEQRHPAIVREGGVSEGKLEAAQSQRHPAQSSPEGKMLQLAIHSWHYTCSPSSEVSLDDLTPKRFACFSG